MNEHLRRERERVSNKVDRCSIIWEGLGCLMSCFCHIFTWYTFAFCPCPSCPIHPSIHPFHSVHCTSDCTSYHPVSFSSSWPCENSDKQVGQVRYRIPKVGSDLTFLHQQQQSWTSPPQHGPAEFASCHHPHTFPLSN